MTKALSPLNPNRKTWHDSGMVGVPVRVHSRTGDDLGVAHVPLPVEVGDVLELGHGPILLLRIGDTTRGS